VKIAGADVVVWLIIFVMVALAKGWSKLQKQIDDDSSTPEEETPPSAPVQRRATPREGVRPLQPQRARPQVPRMAPVPRTAQPAQRTVPRTAARPVGSPAPREGWKIDPEQIRRFVEQLSGQPRSTPQPPVAAPPPVQKAPTPAPEPIVATAAETKPAMAEAEAPPTSSRAAQWAEALRDKQNIRNIIISAEIIGPPKAF
jgi:hypothetical protein